MDKAKALRELLKVKLCTYVLTFALEALSVSLEIEEGKKTQKESKHREYNEAHLHYLKLKNLE